jgi:hypothetical protein
MNTTNKKHKTASKRWLAPIAILSLLAGCATPYSSSGFLGGYSDTALAPDIYRISFQGNGYTSEERTKDFAILRAADLTLSHGYRYFGVVDESNGGRSGVINMPGHSYTTGNAYAVGNMVYGSAQTTYVPGASIPFFFPKSGLLIRCFRERPDGIFAFDAGFVSRSLREKYHVKS